MENREDQLRSYNDSTNLGKKTVRDALIYIKKN